MDGLEFLKAPSKSKRMTRKGKKAQVEKIEIDTSDEVIHKRALGKQAAHKMRVVKTLSEKKLKTIQKRMARQDSFKGVKEIIRLGGITKVIFPSSSMFFIPAGTGGQRFTKIRF